VIRSVIRPFPAKSAAGRGRVKRGARSVTVSERKVAEALQGLYGRYTGFAPEDPLPVS